jgi:hypothetical protein
MVAPTRKGEDRIRLTGRLLHLLPLTSGNANGIPRWFAGIPRISEHRGHRIRRPPRPRHPRDRHRRWRGRHRPCRRRARPAPDLRGRPGTRRAPRCGAKSPAAAWAPARCGSQRRQLPRRARRRPRRGWWEPACSWSTRRRWRPRRSRGMRSRRICASDAPARWAVRVSANVEAQVGAAALTPAQSAVARRYGSGLKGTPAAPLWPRARR